MDKSAMLNKLYLCMLDYYSGDPKRAQHFIKVHSLARLIGTEEGLSEQALFTLETAAFVHDIGIRAAEEKLGYQNGKLQEEMGPPEAEKMLRFLGFPEEVTERVKWLIAHHHTYRNIDAEDYQILVEADFLVNLYEDGETVEAIKAAGRKIFKTETGKILLRTMFGMN